MEYKSIWEVKTILQDVDGQNINTTSAYFSKEEYALKELAWARKCVENKNNGATLIVNTEHSSMYKLNGGQIYHVWAVRRGVDVMIAD